MKMTMIILICIHLLSLKCIKRNLIEVKIPTYICTYVHQVYETGETFFPKTKLSLKWKYSIEFCQHLMDGSTDCQNWILGKNWPQVGRHRKLRQEIQAMYTYVHGPLNPFNISNVFPRVGRVRWHTGSGLPDFSWYVIPKPEKMYQANKKWS
jgi:hypothetical protein